MRSPPPPSSGLSRASIAGECTKLFGLIEGVCGADYLAGGQARAPPCRPGTRAYLSLL
jgi:hypothetical protein